MKKNNFVKLDTIQEGDRVTCDYADIYFEDQCKDTETSQEDEISKVVSHEKDDKEEWISPSDLLIGVVELTPPFTSRITRGKTQEGILAIGNELLDIEHAKFLKSVSALLEENDTSWKYVYKFQRRFVEKKVKSIYQNIFKIKSAIMQREISNFYQNTLQELENYLRSEIRDIIESAQADIISKLNGEIKLKLEKERRVLEKTLQKRFDSEILKIRKYYMLLLHNETYRNNKLIKKAIQDRNDAIKAFCHHIDSKRITTAMYIMSSERKKCRMKQLLVENIQTREINELIEKIKRREDVIEAFRQKDKRIADINWEWEQNIQNILRLFLKFLSFSLKLLPEQTTFLLDFEKMVILQLNEIAKNPHLKSSILIEEEKDLKNVFKFETKTPEEEVCTEKPFVIVGDLSDPIPYEYGSRETIPPDVDLPYFTLERQYIYAKCHGYESIKEFLRTQICLCDKPNQKEQRPDHQSAVSTVSVFKKPAPQASASIVRSTSLTETFIVNDISRMEECPVRKCGDWGKRNTFPYLASYLDYTEDNYRRVTTILGEPSKLDSLPQNTSAKTIARQELPFSKTKEQWHTVGTQYSSQEEIAIKEVPCSCTDDFNMKCPTDTDVPLTSTINDILLKRKRSLDRLIHDNPNLLKIFTDECFDYKL
ncbi:unnamed protein product [Danaus chrysippus]|uniref:(African queen) hypothetical protein n=1 Tax=Danaus chrysippus TaxID=151541 RepID=A0A8J2QJC8_9NEOP|nr:unnamed protein product [Danaus chrysippus]